MAGLTKIVCHWTGGGYEPNAGDLKGYHFLYGEGGEEYMGDLGPEANIDTRDGIYARHAGQFNTGAIGLACCAMAGAVEGRLETYKVPVTKAQFDAMCKSAARLCLTYGIPVERVYMHSEVLARFGRGVYKWDINYLPWVSKSSLLLPSQAGQYLREKVAQHMREMSGRGAKPPKKTVKRWLNRTFRKGA